MSSRTGASSIQQQYTASTTTRYRGSDAADTRSVYSASNSLNSAETQNIMYDRRVIRGSTYSLRKSIENRLNDINQQSINTTKRKTKPKRRVKPRNTDIYKNKMKTPRPVAGRLHAEIQTEPYLEEIYVTKNEKEYGTQTDPFLDRPSTPLFIPKLSGKSISTQIEDGDLFDFDREVEAILEVLIGKTIETSLMEVLEEQELKAFHKYKQEFEQKRNVELAKCQRLEEEERRKEKEKENRTKQAKIQKEQQLLLKKRIDAQRIATEFMENIENAVFQELDKRGHFYDPIVKEIETMFIPEFLKDVDIKVNHIKISNMILDDVIQSFVGNLINDCIQIMDERDQKEKQDEKEEIYKQQLNETFVEKRRAFTQCIKSQREDYDFKQQIVEFINIVITSESQKEDTNNDDDDKKEDSGDENNQEIPADIQRNIEFIDALMARFENKEEPLWEQIQCILDKIGGEVSDKIERVDEYLKKFSIKSHKKELLETLKIYKDDDDNLKKVIIDCLGIDTFNEEIHSTLFDSLKSEEQQLQMNAINELVKDKEDIKQFVAQFIKDKENERIAAEEKETANEATENEENEEDQ